METLEFKLPDFWACPLINDDFSGCNDEDEAQIRAFLSDYKGYHVSLLDDDPSFSKYHDAKRYGVLACDCFTYTLIK